MAQRQPVTDPQIAEKAKGKPLTEDELRLVVGGAYYGGWGYKSVRGTADATCDKQQCKDTADTGLGCACG